KEQILILTARLYGRKSEKNNQLYEQLLLFEEKQDEAIIPAPEDDEVTIPAHSQKNVAAKLSLTICLGLTSWSTSMKQTRPVNADVLKSVTEKKSQKNTM
ncbi:transposase domain-containing protein, partial [Desulfatiferula olefinivorans]